MFQNTICQQFHLQLRRKDLTFNIILSFCHVWLKKSNFSSSFDLKKKRKIKIVIIYIDVIYIDLM